MNCNLHRPFERDPSATNKCNVLPQTDGIKTVRDDDVYNVMQKLNNRPRKSLGFKTPTQMMQRSFAKSGISCVALQS